MSEKLKPCPFCGGKAMFLTIANKSSHSAVGVMFKIKCMKCGTELPKSYECEMYMDQDGGIRTGGRAMRLIDADELEGHIKILGIWDEVENKDVFTNDIKDAILKLIDAQPTAYDPDKVVEQLEKLKSLVPVNRILDDIINDKPKELGMLIAYEKAIKIVKGGGVDA